jgi:glycine cleavage system aminomethyltransferase T
MSREKREITQFSISKKVDDILHAYEYVNTCDEITVKYELICGYTIEKSIGMGFLKKKYR